MNDKNSRTLKRFIAKSNLKNQKLPRQSQLNGQLNLKLNDSNTNYSFSFYVDIASTPIKRLPRSSTPNAKQTICKIKDNRKQTINLKNKTFNNHHPMFKSNKIDSKIKSYSNGYLHSKIKKCLYYSKLSEEANCIKNMNQFGFV
jgi:hypothetical protein